MELEAVERDTVRMEETIIFIGAKIADAVALSIRAMELSACSKAMLIAAQRELEDLFVNLREHRAGGHDE